MRRQLKSHSYLFHRDGMKADSLPLTSPRGGRKYMSKRGAGGGQGANPGRQRGGADAQDVRLRQ